MGQREARGTATVSGSEEVEGGLSIAALVTAHTASHRLSLPVSADTNKQTRYFLTVECQLIKRDEGIRKQSFDSHHIIIQPT